MTIKELKKILDQYDENTQVFVNAHPSRRDYSDVDELDPYYYSNIENFITENCPDFDYNNEARREMVKQFGIKGAVLEL